MQDIDLIFGTATIGDQLDETGSKDVLDYFLSQGYNKIDTAIMYADGKAELYLGKILSPKQKSESCIFSFMLSSPFPLPLLARVTLSDKSVDRVVYIASKINKMTEPYKALTRESVIAQVDTILKKLQVDHIDLLYHYVFYFLRSVYFILFYFILFYFFTPQIFALAR
jgi:aryl-alcohol dehydrogenase-like predicted oxidoreductase